MKLLLDSHTLIWFLADDPRLSAMAAAVLDDNANVAYVSAASAWEITTKHRIGKLPDAAEIANDFATVVRERGFEALPVSIPHAQLAGNLEGAHKDPFDRMLIAQALIEQLVLISNETRFDAFGVSRLW